MKITWIHIYNKKDNDIDDHDGNNKLQKWTKHLVKILNTKFEFISYDITGRNYMAWVIDIEMHLESMGLTETIKEMNSMSSQDKSKDDLYT